jgi:hypothetical protein
MGVMAGQHPARRQLHCTDQAGLIGMLGDGAQLDIYALACQQHRSPAHRQLADMAGAAASADHDALGAFPGLQAQETARHGGELDGILLDNGMDQAGGQGIGAGEHLVELRLGDLLGRCFTERILTLRPELLAPILEDGTEGPTARAIANEAVLVAQFLVVGVDRHVGQDASAVCQHRRRYRLCGL